MSNNFLLEWHKSESYVDPVLLDKTSSTKYVIVRRNVEEVEREEDEETVTVYQYDEKMIPREDWDTYESVMDNSSGIFDLAAMVDENSQAIMDLAEMIGGE